MARKIPIDDTAATASNPDAGAPEQDPPLPADPRPVADELDQAESAIRVEATQQVAQAEERLLRLAAEYDNYRKRTIREKTEAFDRGAMALAERLLDVLGDIDRLASSDPAATTYDTFRGAFDLLQRKIGKELESAGLERLDPVGAPFDPNEHEAVAVAMPETPEQDHTVKATFQPGYKFKGTVIRPARVQVYSSHGAA